MRRSRRMVCEIRCLRRNLNGTEIQWEIVKPSRSRTPLPTPPVFAEGLIDVQHSRSAGTGIEENRFTGSEDHTGKPALSDGFDT